MTLYRKQQRISPRMAAAVALAALIVLGAVWFLLSANIQTTDPRAHARAKALEAAQGLELVSIEYSKVLRGEPSGAPGALSRAQSAFNDARSELTKIDPQATDTVATALTMLGQKVSARAPAAEVSALADSARAQLLALAKP